MLTEKLLNAAQTGEVLRVRYFAGSTPGAERQLRPISIADGKVLALCLQSGKTKLFAIEKLEEVIDGVPSSIAASQRPSPPIFQTVGGFVLHHQSAFEAHGWVVKTQGNSVSLHRTFKNGKLIETPDVDLSYEAETYDAVFDGEKVVEQNHRERSRPWILRGKKKTTKTFAELAKAHQCFLEWAAQLAPKPTP